MKLLEVMGKANEVRKKSGLGHPVENHTEASNTHEQSTKDFKAPGSTYRAPPYLPRQQNHLHRYSRWQHKEKQESKPESH